MSGRSGWAIHEGDCLDVMRGMADASVDSIVTDPPYGLGFMGKAWDIGVPAVDVFVECLRVLKPGGHLLAFGGSRTYHRLAVAVEDAGFEVRDQLIWLHGNGFPKSIDVAKAIDKAAGVEREDKFEGGMTRDAAHTRAARQWQGWGTALKPAHEPIVLARKALVGTVARNVVAHGCGAINVDGCRIEVDRSPDQDGATNFRAGGGSAASGRFPANVMHDGSDEVIDLFPASAGATAPVRRRGADKFCSTYGAFPGNIDEAGSTFHGDTGSAARFFYCAKANRADRNEGCESIDEPRTLTPWQSLHGSSGAQNPGSFQAEGTHKAAHNNHPTVKPTKLMRHLCRLVTPPGGLVLDPFLGSGSTGKAAILEGFRFVGIEREASYAQIARLRLLHAEVLRGEAVAAEAADRAQEDLFA